MLFLIGYRQTEGARRARLAAANVDLERILVRRIVIDKYIPKEVDIVRLMEGKARDHRVRVTDVLSTEQLLSAAYTRIVESDLIASDQREEILSRITPVLMRAEVEPEQEETLEEIASSQRASRVRDTTVAAIAIAAAIAGTLTAAIPEASRLGEEILESREIFLASAVTALASLTVIGWLYLVMRSRTRQEEKGRPHRLSKHIALEEQVYKILKNFGTIKRSLSGYPDFLMDYKDRTFAIEVKAWPARVPRSIVLLTVERLRQAAKEAGAAEAMIITLESAPSVCEMAKNEGTKVFTVKELKSYLKGYAPS